MLLTISYTVNDMMGSKSAFRRGSRHQEVQEGKV